MDKDELNLYIVDIRSSLSQLENLRGYITVITMANSAKDMLIHKIDITIRDLSQIANDMDGIFQ